MTSAIFAHKELEIQHDRSSYGFRAIETPERAVPISLPDSQISPVALGANYDEQFKAYLAKTRRALPDMRIPDRYWRFLSELFDDWDGIKIAAGQLAECRAVLDRLIERGRNAAPSATAFLKEQKAGAFEPAGRLGNQDAP